MEITKTKLFKILSLESRMKIIDVLFDEESSVNKIVERTGMEQTLVSHQLATLKQYKIVHSRIQGKQRMYSLNQETMAQIMVLVDEHLLLFQNTGENNGN